MSDKLPALADLDAEFAGFEHLDANFVYCPNQFFDYCLPRLSRGALRLVSYILHQTLRHLDENGNPVREDIAIPFNRLVREARISRGAIRVAIDEALAENLIECVQEGRSDRRDQQRAVGEYRIAWDSPAAPYSVNPERFRGFFAGEGYRTPTPHAFFTRVVPTQTAATTKIVGAVIRHTVGFQTKHGGRRKESALSYRFLGNYTKLSSKRSLNEGIKAAMSGGFIRRTITGKFVPGRTDNQPSCYSLQWLGGASEPTTSSISVPKNHPVQKVNANQFKKDIQSGSKSVPNDQSKKGIDRKEPRKETTKERGNGTLDVDVQSAIPILLEQGVSEETAAHVASTVDVVEIQRQIKWLKHRNVRSNHAGYLVSACLNRYSEPEQVKAKRLGLSIREAEYRTTEVDRAAELKRFRVRKEELIAVWTKQPLLSRKRWFEEAIRNTDDLKVQACISFDDATSDNPHKFVLDAMAIELGLEPVTERVLRPQASAVSLVPAIHQSSRLKEEAESSVAD